MGVRVEFLYLHKLVETFTVAHLYDLEIVIDCLDLVCLQTNFGLVDLLHN